CQGLRGVFPPAIDSAQRDLPAGYGTEGSLDHWSAPRVRRICLFSPAPCDRLRALHAEQEEQRTQLRLVRVGEAPHARRGAGAWVLLRRRRRGGGGGGAGAWSSSPCATSTSSRSSRAAATGRPTACSCTRRRPTPGATSRWASPSACRCRRRARRRW